MSEIELKSINASQFYRTLNQEMVYDAKKYITDNHLELIQPTKYYVVVDNEPLPPKELLRVIAQLNGYKINENTLSGGKANEPFKSLGFAIVEKEVYPFLDGSIIAPQVRKYQNAIDNTDWLKINEVYKFNFIKWCEKNIDFNSDSDESIIQKIKESQEQLYSPGSTIKGVNFIQTIVRYQNDYLTLKDIQKLRGIITKKIPLTKENLILSFRSFPKTSAFLCLFSPKDFIAYDAESLPAYQFLSGKESYPKKDFGAFQFFQIFYKNVKSFLKESHLNTSVFKSILEVDELNELHWNFITQDLLLFITRQIMNIDTIQKKYDYFIENESPEYWDWYKNIKKHTEFIQKIKENCLVGKYKNYDELNNDFKSISGNESEDFLQRYLFESDNGFSSIRNQLIKTHIRKIIRDKVKDDYSLINDILITDSKEKVFELINKLIEGNNWTVIYRFLRALFPNDFTAVDAPNHFEALTRKLYEDFDITLQSYSQIDRSTEILNLITYDDIYKAQIFFWMYRAENNEQDNQNDKSEIMNEQSKYPLNQILFGAPGTGKTYKTKKIAVEIIENADYSEEEREVLLEKYDKYFKSGQINFSTFHQSVSYEDFIEGIKPILGETEIESSNKNTDSIKYEIKDGVFKKMSLLASSISNKVKIENNIDFENKSFYKMSIGGINRLDKHNWCFENNLIFLGWGDDRDFSELSKIKDWNTFRDAFKTQYPELVEQSKYVIQAVYIFQKMEIGDIVVISKGNRIIDGIGVIESEYFYDDTQEFEHYQFRKVKWLGTNLNLPADRLLDIGLSQQTIYELNKKDIKIDVLKDLFNKSENKEGKENYVLIIDEINRGNVSAIFGELITLIEEDKRKGVSKHNPEFIEVELPYSNEKFSVPDNLYIIGTMNTADRSVEALDTALRRRFSFIEMQPKPELLAEVDYNEINLIELLSILNQRIELLIDKDHQIGHSYFFKIQNFTDLVEVFRDKIIPLLEEYFYGDFGKIGLVLGDRFIKPKAAISSKMLAHNFKYNTDLLEEKELFEFTPYKDWNIATFKSIYQKIIESEQE